MNAQKTVRLVFVCSGAADVGELTDRAARALRDRGLAAMSCLASIGARDPDVLFNTDLAERVLVIAGCPQACARRTFEEAGLRRFVQFDLSEVGLLKGTGAVTAENMECVVLKAVSLLGPNRE